MLQGCTTASEAAQISKEGQDIMNQIENNSKPVVAAIMGKCLGGGLEVRFFMLPSQMTVRLVKEPC